MHAAGYRPISWISINKHSFIKLPTDFINFTPFS
jgi:hypothetical protein